jgi:hypothetical protein
MYSMEFATCIDIIISFIKLSTLIVTLVPFVMMHLGYKHDVVAHRARVHSISVSIIRIVNALLMLAISWMHYYSRTDRVMQGGAGPRIVNKYQTPNETEFNKILARGAGSTDVLRNAFKHNEVAARLADGSGKTNSIEKANTADAAADAAKAEEEAKAAEAAKAEAEAAKTEAEAAEAAKAEAEAAKTEAEAAKAEAEAAKAAAKAAKAEAEAAKAEAEAAKAAAKAAKAEAEAAKAEAEATKAEAKAAEAAKTEAEAAKAEAEAAKTEAEAAKAEAEAAKAEAKVAKAEAEAAKAEAEAAKAEAEAAKAEAKVAKADAETAKADAETAKTEAEAAKTEAEAAKAEAEAAKAEAKVAKAMADAAGSKATPGHGISAAQSRPVVDLAMDAEIAAAEVAAAVVSNTKVVSPEAAGLRRDNAEAAASTSPNAPGEQQQEGQTPATMSVTAVLLSKTKGLNNAGQSNAQDNAAKEREPDHTPSSNPPVEGQAPQHAMYSFASIKPKKPDVLLETKNVDDSGIKSASKAAISQTQQRHPWRLSILSTLLALSSTVPLMLAGGGSVQGFTNNGSDVQECPSSTVYLKHTAVAALGVAGFDIIRAASPDDSHCLTLAVLAWIILSTCMLQA